MPTEQYIETILIRQDRVELPVGEGPTFIDDQCDMEFEFEGTIKLVQIVKSVQNAAHNAHDYVFKIVDIKKLKED